MQRSENVALRFSLLFCGLPAANLGAQITLEIASRPG